MYSGATGLPLFPDFTGSAFHDTLGYSVCGAGDVNQDGHPDVVVGAPLGVCVNCAAPIAKGLYSGGARAETTLSAMIASPTLNIVVLTMLLSILPLYLVVAKIGLSIAVILVAVPLICRLLPTRELQLAPDQLVACPIPAPESSGATMTRAVSKTSLRFST